MLTSGCVGKIFVVVSFVGIILYLLRLDFDLTLTYSSNRISRGESQLPSSDVHFFTSHFMTTLKGKGPEAVVSWTEKKDINIFEKKLIFIPVNADLHWSLLVVVNPGLIANVYNDDLPMTEEHSFILFLDSLKMHNKNVYAKHIRRWLNSEHRRLGRGEVGGRIDPFIDDSIPVVSPKSTYFNYICFIFTMGSNRLSLLTVSNLLSSPTPRKRMRLRCVCL